ncbi:MAG: hypothetical protein KDD94_14785, partial [Calditrichaeota bacterium]|nr:hypothetical protein [Calditrichota bacterium]
MTGKFICVLFVIVIGFAQAWPKRVLLTNDDGIDEKRLQNLAFAFAKVTETYMVASTVDRSGSGNYMAIGKYQKSLFVMKEHQEKNLVVYAVAGYPADCVAFAVGGLLKDNPPDLVISGI